MGHNEKYVCELIALPSDNCLASFHLLYFSFCILRSLEGLAPQHKPHYLIFTKNSRRNQLIDFKNKSELITLLNFFHPEVSISPQKVPCAL